jgi:uncharacterized membrane protein YwzB
MKIDIFTIMVEECYTNLPKREKINKATISDNVEPMKSTIKKFVFNTWTEIHDFAKTNHALGFKVHVNMVKIVKHYGLCFLIITWLTLKSITKKTVCLKKTCKVTQLKEVEIKLEMQTIYNQDEKNIQCIKTWEYN